MAEEKKAAMFRRSSGLLVHAPPDHGGEAKALNDALGKLSAVTRAISANVRHINDTLERILVDKPDIEELERMLEPVIITLISTSLQSWSVAEEDYRIS